MSDNYIRDGGPIVTVGTQIIVKSSKQRGRIKYIGQTLFDSWLPRDTIWYGIECIDDKSNSNGNTNSNSKTQKQQRYAISVDHRIYFMSTCKNCLFTDKNNIIKIHSGPRFVHLGLLVNIRGLADCHSRIFCCVLLFFLFLILVFFSFFCLFSLVFNFQKTEYKWWATTESPN